MKSFQLLPQPPSPGRNWLSTRRPSLGVSISTHAAAVRQQREAQGAEVDQQAVRADVVGAHRLVVEGAGVDAGTLNTVRSSTTSPPMCWMPRTCSWRSRLAQVFDGEARVAAALEVQIAVQNAVDRSSLGPRRGFPRPRRAEQVERGVGGDQLHHRRRVHRLRRVVGDQRLAGIDRLDDDGDAGGRNLRRLERAEHVGRQAVGERRPAQDGERQQRQQALHAASVG
jgi:hypothetical protein